MRLPALLLVLAACAQVPAPAPPPASPPAYSPVAVEPGSAVAPLAEALSEMVPLRLPAQVLERPIMETGYLGLTRLAEPGILILVDPRLSDLERDMVLVHEWAHAVVIDRGQEEADPHGPAWGAAYAEVFRAWQRWNQQP